MTEDRDRSNRIESSSEGDPLERRLQPLYYIGIFVSVLVTGAGAAGLVILAVQPEWSGTAFLVASAASGLMVAVGVAELLIRYLAGERRDEPTAGGRDHRSGTKLISARP